MFRIILLCQIFIASSIFNTTICQIIVIESRHFLVNDIEEDVAEKLLMTVNKEIKKYSYLAKMTNLEKSADGFANLFASDAHIYDDISESPLAIHHDEYIALAKKHFVEEGIQFKMVSAFVRGIEYHADGYYTIDVTSRKHLHSEIDQYGKAYYCKTGRNYNLRFTFRIDENDLSVAKIQSIQGNLVKECQDKSLLMSLISKASMTSVQFDESSFYKENLNTFNYNPINNSQFGIGLKLHRALSPKNNIFLGAGIFYSTTNITNLWNGSYAYPDEDVEGTPITKFTQILNGKEAIKIESLELPLGLKIRLMQWEKCALFVEPTLNLGFNLMNNRTNHSFNGERIQYDIDEEGNISSLNTSDGIPQTSQISSSENLAPRPFVISSAINFHIQYYLTNEIALVLGAQSQYYINSFFQVQNQSLLPDDILTNNESLTNQYLNDTKTINWGIHLGLTYKY